MFLYLQFTPVGSFRFEDFVESNFMVVNGKVKVGSREMTVTTNFDYMISELKNTRSKLYA